MSKALATVTEELASRTGIECHVAAVKEKRDLQEFKGMDITVG